MSFVYEQTTPKKDWCIKHGLNGFPKITVVDIYGVTYYPPVTYIDSANVVVHCGALFSGSAYLT